MNRASSEIRGMILAAGFGTRLKSLGLNRPKPLLPVCAVPLIRYTLAQFKAAGIREVIINLHHEGEQIRRELGDGSEWGMALFYSVEKGQILGTGGGIRKVKAFFQKKTFVVVNGKIVSDLDLGRAIAFHRKKGVLATMVVHPLNDAHAWGAVEVSPSGFIRRLAGFEAPEAARDRDLKGYVFTGIHVLEPGFLDAVGEGPQCIVRTAYRHHLKSGTQLGGYVDRGYWQDHSTPARYLAGNFNLMDRTTVVWPGLPGPVGVDAEAEVSEGVVVRPPVKVCAGAKVGTNAVVGPYAVVGRNARIGPGCKVIRSVIWDGVEVNRSVDRSVVTTGSLVRVNMEDQGATIGPPLKKS